MSILNKLSKGWQIAKNSLQVLQQNKQLVMLPIISSTALLLILVSFGVTAVYGFNLFDGNNGQQTNRLFVYTGIFVYYLINYFVVVFFNVALMHCAKLYFNGQKPTVQQGIQFSITKLSSIFKWALFAATVGTILKAIQEESGSIGKIITGLIGMVWSIATFFVIPIIAYENVGPIEAFKKSSAMMKQKWGESAGATFSLGLIQLLSIVVIAVPLFFIGSTIHIAVGITLALLAVFIIVSIISAAQSIFVSAVYHNIQGNPVENFNNHLIDHLFETK